MKIYFILLITISFYQSVFAQEDDTKLNEAIQKLMDEQIHPKGAKAVHNIQFSFIYKDQYEFHGVSGLEKKKGTALSVNHQFKIASVTKTFTATIILQMMEEGKLKISDKINKFFDENIINQLHIYKGKNYGNDITIDQLLNHTSGLADFIFDDIKLMVGLKLNPKKSWTPQSLLDNYFKHNLNKKAAFIPGVRYDYSDTNYLLLGLIIEKLSGQSLQQQYRTRIIEPLKLTKTYFDNLETGSDKVMHQYYNRRNVTETLNTSFDWAGGGLVSTTKDLATFIRALFKSELFQSSKTLELMLPEKADGYRYGFGLEGFKFKPKIEGQELVFQAYGHSGFWGVYMRYLPDEDITATYSFGQVNDKYHIPLASKATIMAMKYFKHPKLNITAKN